MTFDDKTPLLEPRHRLTRRLELPIERYRGVFMDAGYWRPVVERVCSRHGISVASVESGEPGSFPTFIVNRTWVVKLFGQLFDGLRCWATELEVAAVLREASTGVPVSEVIGGGVLSRAPEWRYLVSRFIGGASFARQRGRLDHEQRQQVARQLGPMLRAVHDFERPDLSVLRWDWEDWTSFVAAQKQGLAQRHRGWGTLPSHLIPQLDAYVAEYRVDVFAPPALVHADLHQDHVLGGCDDDGIWRIAGVIDWGDARIGDRFYELPALHLGSFHGDTSMLRVFLDAYGWPDYRSDTFVRRAMTMTLLHEFDVLDGIAVPGGVETLDDLADAIWRV